MRSLRKNTKSNSLLSRRHVVLAAAALFFSGVFAAACRSLKRIQGSLKTREPSKALVVWYSQVGHTERVGRLIAARWRMAGLNVDEGDISSIDPLSLPSYDIIAAGSPVFYSDMAQPLRQWLASIPAINGAAVVSFVTFGGTGHNQHNTACYILDMLSEKGGIPVAMDTFGNMSTFAVTWSSGRTERILKYRHLPDENTFEQVRKFAAAVLDKITSSDLPELAYRSSLISIMKGIGPGGFKILTGRHKIDKDICVECMLCQERCPAGAIDISSHSVNRKSCIFCLACVNLCPVGAHDMIFRGDRVYGFNEFIEKNGIVIKEPEELR